MSGLIFLECNWMMGLFFSSSLLGQKNPIYFPVRPILFIKATTSLILCSCPRVWWHDTASGLTWSEGSRGDLDLTVGLVRLEGWRWAQLSRKGFWALGAGGAGAGAVTSIVRVLLLVHCHQLERHGRNNILVSFGLNLGGDHPLVLEWGWRFDDCVYSMP